MSCDTETARAPGSNLTLSLSEGAKMARDDGREDLMNHAAQALRAGRRVPGGAHAEKGVIAPEVGVAVDEFHAAEENFGRLINALQTQLRVQGRVGQCMGQALSEPVVHDADEQRLTASLMDSALPRAADMPMIGVTPKPVPLAANAVQDAPWNRGVRQADMPFTWLTNWDLLRDGTAATR